jgi:NAD(P)-dependent dehydrogenase (short-subunit alcohol dehydrogenase family)
VEGVSRSIRASDFPHPEFAETDDATLDEMLDVNYRSAFFMARAVLPHMRLWAQPAQVTGAAVPIYGKQV